MPCGKGCSPEAAPCAPCSRRWSAECQAAGTTGCLQAQRQAWLAVSMAAVTPESEKA